MSDEMREETYRRDFGFIPVPKRLQYNVEKPLHFGLPLNIAFGAASTFAIMNLYWCQPLLIELSKDFNSSNSSTRRLILILIFVAASLTIGLSVTRSFAAFSTLSYLVGVVTVTPQVLIPLAADLAPPARRASAMSIVLAGLLLGILLARVLSGIIGEFSSWRAVYYLAIGVQYFVMAACYWVVPDYPAKNQHLTYLDILRSMAKYAVTEPLLIQACLISIGSMASFTNFWVTLTFLLGDDPYHYSTSVESLVIGLFGLIGIAAVAMGPVLGIAIDGLVPWYATLFSIFMLACSHAVYTGAAGLSVAAVIITTVGIDTFRQMLEVSMATRIFGIAPEARARLNAVYILSLFIGQVMGTSVGTQVFVAHGWRASGALSMAFCAWMFFILLLRGPHCDNKTWFGYQGGIEPRKSVVDISRDRAPMTIDEKKDNVETGSSREKEDLPERGNSLNEKEFTDV
ncbi:major facilitator superfamily domain-containing protein [Mucidula mucida]|nr:major facilitator superfamily domain-containing protein [Mucidula mucida]